MRWRARKARRAKLIAHLRRQLVDMLGAAAVREDILTALADLDRASFVRPDQRDRAWLDRPLPIDCAQTISQPTIVALMTHLLEPERRDRVLEIGTGSGYQAAILASLVEEVWSIERHAELADQAAARLAALGLPNVHVRNGDGYRGWPQAAPYDKIIVTAAADRLPAALGEQLAIGGRMVLPLASPDGAQTLTVIDKPAAGEIRRHDSIGVRFVPMVHGDPKPPQRA